MYRFEHFEMKELANLKILTLKIETEIILVNVTHINKAILIKSISFEYFFLFNLFPKLKEG